MKFITHNKKLTVSVSLSLFMIFLFASVVSAVTIVVDGTKESGWAGTVGDPTGLVTDVNEPTIPDGVDIEGFLYTNDSTNLYLGIDTYTTTTVSPSGLFAPYMVLCFDTDNNNATGGSSSQCDGISGVDRSLLLQANGSGFDVTVYDGVPGGPTIGATTSIATAGDFTEVSIDLVSMGLGNGVCSTSNVEGLVYFDNRTTAPDDNNPDAGTFLMTCSAPTAVTYRSAQSSVSNMNDLLNWGLTVLLGFTAGFMMVRHQKDKDQK